MRAEVGLERADAVHEAEAGDHGAKGAQYDGVGTNAAFWIGDEIGLGRLWGCRAEEDLWGVGRADDG